jgi:hypothetical protein
MLPAIAAALIGAGVSGVGMALKNTQRKQNQQDQKDLMNLQQQNQMGLNRQMQQIEMENWENTNYDAQKKQMEKAGLNPGLMYGGSGGGSMIMDSGSGGSAAGGQAQRQDIDTSGLGMQIQQMALLKAQKDNIEADTKNKLADAENKGANTTTTNTIRDVLYENMRQSGVTQWYENLEKEIKLDPDSYANGEENVIGNKVYQSAIRINENSYVLKQLNQDLLKTVAETKNLDASAILTNNKAQGYWQELLNATSQANSQAVQAAAQKLSAEFNTGEFTNWKTWADLGVDAIKALGSLSGFMKPKSIPKIK